MLKFLIRKINKLKILRDNVVNANLVVVGNAKINSQGVTFGLSSRKMLGEFIFVSGKSVDSQVLLQIGQGSVVSNGCEFHMGSCNITLGQNVLVGADCLFLSSDFHGHYDQDANQRKSPGEGEIVIGDDVFIGARAIILKGANVPAKAIIPAGAIITRKTYGNHSK